MSDEYQKYEVVDRDGQVLSLDQVAYAYSREGRHKYGHELPNPQPLEPPLGFVPQETIFEQMRQMVLREMDNREEELETEEEANDFDIGDDFDPTSPWEIGFEPTRPWAETLREIQESVKRDVPDLPEPRDPSAGGSGAAPPSPPGEGGEK